MVGSNGFEDGTYQVKHFKYILLSLWLPWGYFLYENNLMVCPILYGFPHEKKIDSSDQVSLGQDL